jgi:cell division protease FtsH
MVRDYGLSGNLGPVSYGDHAAGPHPSLMPRGHSERTQWLVDREIAALLTRAETRARDLLTQHTDALNQLTAALLEQETISGDQVRALVQAASPIPLAARTRPPAAIASPASNGPAGQPAAPPLPATPPETAPGAVNRDLLPTNQ